MFKHQAIEKLIQKRREQYGATKNVYCPLLKEAVYYNSKGFFHATHDGRDRIRSETDARMRLNLLPYTPKVITEAKKLARPPQLVPVSDTDNKYGKELAYYELIASVGRNHRGKKTIIVVLRRIGNGRLHYYSVRYAKNKNRP